MTTVPGPIQAVKDGVRARLEAMKAERAAAITANAPACSRCGYPECDCEEDNDG